MAFSKGRARRNSISSPPIMSEDPIVMHPSNSDDEVQPARKDSEVRMVLLGKTGSGKSSTGNTILGRNAFKVEESYRSVTQESERCYRYLGGGTLTVIDTPGLFDTHPDKVVKDQLENAMKLAYPGVHAFLLVIRVDVKFTKEEINSMQWIVKTLGEEFRKHTIVLFTHGNELKGKTIEQFVQGHPDLNELVARMADYHVFENEHNENNETQVTELLEKIDNLKKKNESHMYTTEMYEKVQNARFGTKDIKDIAGTAGAVGLGVGAALKVIGQDTTTSAIAGVAASVVTLPILGFKKMNK